MAYSSHIIFLQPANGTPFAIRAGITGNRPGLTGPTTNIAAALQSIQGFQSTATTLDGAITEDHADGHR
jgi:hypothetical protein